ncbi:hypothetical protein YTPLAS73_00740 [Nitrosarchaeum sp.]|nr:hypothetical protein YTPLAS73_00740 [Nitrosarchaeum sp.]
MVKWADYLISKVSYDPNHLITFVVRHKDTAKGITTGILVDRKTISSDIKNGISHITIYNNKDSWKKGYKIKIFPKNGNYYLRIDENKVKLDYLGDLPEAPYIESKQEQTSTSKPPPEPKRFQGALPKESPQELPQELDLAPEPIDESDDDVTEQLLRLEQLEKQILELESKSQNIVR